MSCRYPRGEVDLAPLAVEVAVALLQAGVGGALVGVERGHLALLPRRLVKRGLFGLVQRLQLALGGRERLG